VIDRPPTPHLGIEEIEANLDELDRAASGPRAGRRRWLRFAPVAVIVLGIVLVFATGLNRYLSLEALQEKRNALLSAERAHPVEGLAAYVLAYAALVAFSIPGSMIMTMTGGFLFGVWLGGVAATVGATIGATALFLAARTAIGDLLKRKARSGGMIEKLEKGVRTNAFSYLLVLRLVPAFPFWMCNLAAGFVPIPLRTYVLATVLGVLPPTLIYASIGSGLGRVFDQGGTPDAGMILTPGVLGPLFGLALLSLLPVVLHAWRVRRRKAAGAG